MPSLSIGTEAKRTPSSSRDPAVHVLRASSASQSQQERLIKPTSCHRERLHFINTSTEFRNPLFDSFGEMQGTLRQHIQPAGTGGAAPASRRGSPGAAAHRATPRRAAISSASARASSVVHIPQPDTSKTSYSLLSPLRSGTSTLRSHPKAFSCLISALLTRPIHTSICEMWELEETWRCGYPAAER